MSAYSSSDTMKREMNPGRSVAASKAACFSGFSGVAFNAVAGLAAGIVNAGVEAAFGALLNAAKGYFGEITNSAENIKADLDLHKGLIGDIKGLWNQAEGAASNYGVTTEAGLRVEARANIDRLDSDFQSSLKALQTGDILNQGGFLSASANARLPFAGAIDRLRDDLKDGRADIISFREEVSKIADALPAGEQFDFAAKMLADTKDMASLQGEVQRSVDMFQALYGHGDAAARAMGDAAENMTAVADATAAGLPAMREAVQLLGTIGNAGGFSFSDIQAFASGRSPTYTTAAGFQDGGITGGAPRGAALKFGQEIIL